VKVTFDLDAELYRAVRVEAARDDRSIRDVVGEALSGWLERRETAEDISSAAAAFEEYKRDGGIAAEEFFRHHAAESREKYGRPDEPGET
jgi:hypothetical protein